MRLDFSGERVLAVVAHPDDAELLCAGTLARAARDGAAVGICVLTRGDKGQPDPPLDNLAAVRSAEMQAAAALLGAELHLAGFSDGELFDCTESRLALTEIYRRFRPSLVLAHAPADYHPDHQAASAIAAAATWFCASAGQKTASASLPRQPALWWLDTIDMLDFEPGFFVDIFEFVPLKQQMLRCHASQLARGGASDFSPLEELMLCQCHTRGAQCGVTAAEAFQPALRWKRVGAW